jgi:hypothetical protein
MVPAEAARQAGYKDAEKVGKRLYTLWKDVIDEKRARQDEMPPAEVLANLAAIASGRKDATASQVKALEQLARIHGLLSDKLEVSMDREELLSELGVRLNQTI